jgi:hypothetical protein
VNMLARTRTWDYALTVATVVLLGTLGLQSFLGTCVRMVGAPPIPGWEASGYGRRSSG